MDVKNYANLADLTYKDLHLIYANYEKFDKKPKIKAGDGVEYEILRAVSNPRTGYEGAALFRPDTREIIVAHRGTWPQKGSYATDILVDLEMAVRNTNRQYDDAAALTRFAVEQTKIDEYRGFPVRQVGHSLGGTLAQLCANNFNQEGITFNAYGAAGLKQAVSGRSPQITNYMKAADPVSAASNHLGRNVVLASEREIGQLTVAGYARSANAPSALAFAVGYGGAEHGIGRFTQGVSEHDFSRALEHKATIANYRADFAAEAQKAAKAAGGLDKALEDIGTQQMRAQPFVTGSAEDYPYEVAAPAFQNESEMFAAFMETDFSNPAQFQTLLERTYAMDGTEQLMQEIRQDFMAEQEAERQRQHEMAMEEARERGRRAAMAEAARPRMIRRL